MVNISRPLQLSLSEPSKSFQNYVINPTFDVWQYSTSQTSAGYGSDDQYFNDHNGSTKTHSQQAFVLGQTDVPGNPNFYSRTLVTSVAGAGNYVRKEHRIEKVSTLSGSYATVTFWARADSSKNIALELVQNFGTGGSPSATVSIAPQLIALTNLWQKISKLIVIPSVSGKILGTDKDFLGIRWWFDAGSTYAANSANLGQQSGTFDIANVSLIRGNVTQEDDPTSPRNITDEILRCKRFYQIICHRFAGYAPSSGIYGRCAYNFSPMRIASPSLTVVNSSATNLTSHTPYVNTNSSITVDILAAGTGSIVSAFDVQLSATL